MKRVVITGAKGSIGSALLARLEYNDSVGGIDIEDWDIRHPYMRHALKAPYDHPPQLVYHLAASKDAPAGEKDPREVMLTNAVGTQHVLDRWPDAKIVLASTCKACAPETAYGASKLLAERLVLNAGGSVARFHNVRETRGNVFQTWKRIDGALPVTNCQRYFISIDQALDLLIAVSTLPPGRYLTHPGELRTMTSVANEEYPGRPTIFIPRRRGDRLTEPLIAPHETIHLTGIKGILEVKSPHD